MLLSDKKVFEMSYTDQIRYYNSLNTKERAYQFFKNRRFCYIQIDNIVTNLLDRISKDLDINEELCTCKNSYWWIDEKLNNKREILKLFKILKDSNNGLEKSYNHEYYSDVSIDLKLKIDGFLYKRVKNQDAYYRCEKYQQYYVLPDYLL